MADEVTDEIDWEQFWEQTRTMFKKGETPDGRFYEQLTKQAWSRAISYEDFYYLLSRFPALVIRHVEREDFPKEVSEPKVIKSRGGWDIIDYGDWLMTSPGRLLWGPYCDGDPDSEQTPIIKGNGTLVQQSADTAYDVIAMAVEKGWPAAYVVHGFYGMVRAAWIAAEALSYQLDGFTATVNDRVVLSWVEKLLEHRQQEIVRRVKNRSLQSEPGT